MKYYTLQYYKEVIMARKQKEFISATISGAELECKFAFPKIFFTKNLADRYIKEYFDIGFLENIGWQVSNSASPKYTLTNRGPVDIYPGMEIAEGQMTFKVFHKNSFSELKSLIMQGINGGADKIKFPTLYETPFLSFEDNFTEWEFHSDNSKVDWGQLPPFEIILISKSKNQAGIIEVRKKTIKGVYITSEASGVAINSTEFNNAVSFMAIGEITDWEKYEGKVTP